MSFETDHPLVSTELQLLNLQLFEPGGASACSGMFIVHWLKDHTHTENELLSSCSNTRRVLCMFSVR